MSKTSSVVSILALVSAVLLGPVACGSDDDNGGGAAVPVGQACSSCVATACAAQEQACTDASCTSCQSDVTQADCKTGEFAAVATCACDSCASACQTECNAYEGKPQGGGGSGGSPSTGGSCGISWKAAACEACMDASCCGVEQTCVGNADCSSFFQCLLSGTDQSTCETSHPGGVSAGDAVIECFQTSCGSACGDDSGAGGGGGSTTGAQCGISWKTDACQSCMDTSCCTQQSSCAGDAECGAILTCAAQGGGDACTTDHPDGVTDFNALASCLEGPCASACGAGSD